MSDTPATNAPSAPAPTTNVGETTFWLDGRILLAALKFASGDESRLVLVGVFVDVDFETARVRVTATDGRRAVMMKVNNDGEPEHDVIEAAAKNPALLYGEIKTDRFILPADFIKRIKPLISRGEPNVQLEIQPGALDGKRRVLAMSPVTKRGVIGETIEGVYPKVDVVFGTDRSPLVAGRVKEGETDACRAGAQLFGALNTEYLADFGALLTTLDPSRSGGTLIYRAGDMTRAIHLRPATILAAAEIEAVIMPINVDDPESIWERPAWLGEEIAGATTVTIKTGSTTVRIDATGIHADSAAADVPQVEPETLDAAKAVLVERGFLSASVIQRRLRVGYNRAMNIIDRLLADGVIVRGDDDSRFLPAPAPATDDPATSEEPFGEDAAEAAERTEPAAESATTE